MFNFCKDNIEGKTFIYLLEDEIDAIRAKFTKRFNNMKTILGTTLFHELFQKLQIKLELSFLVKTRIYAKIINLGMSLYQNP